MVSSDRLFFISNHFYIIKLSMLLKCMKNMRWRMLDRNQLPPGVGMIPVE